MNLAEWNKLQLDQQQDALIKEFDYWRNNSRPNTDFAKHQSQILGITGTVKEFLDGLSNHISDQNEPFEQNALHSKGLLYANHMWAFFRSKFALRLINNYNYSLQNILKCTDEFAWNCYEPARKAAQQAGKLHGDELKEPPLTFFASDAGPYMAQRNALFGAEGIAGHSQDFKRFNAALEQLPVPIIGIPWAQSEQISTAVVIAHEVGHLVERDFLLASALKNGIRANSMIEGDRMEHWLNWASELFADAYAILCTGAAYPIALMEYLVAPKRIVENETLEDEAAKSYPPRSLRMNFNFALLKLLGLPDENLATSWASAYSAPSLPNYQKFCQDAASVAEIFLQTPMETFAGEPITQVMTTTPGEWQVIQQKSVALLGSLTKRERPSIDLKDALRFRQWFAAATLANYSDPSLFTKQNGQKYLWEKLASSIPGTVRGGVKEEKPEATLSIQRAGQLLLEQFMEMTESSAN